MNIVSKAPHSLAGRPKPAGFKAKGSPPALFCYKIFGAFRSRLKKILNLVARLVQHLFQRKLCDFF